MRRRLLFACAAVLAPLAVFACDGIAGIRDLSPVAADAAPTGANDAAFDASSVSDGGSWSVVALGSSPVRLVVDDDYVYWTTLPGVPGGGEAVRMRKGGGAPELVAIGVEQPNGLAADRDYLYVTSGQNFGDGVVTRIAKEGGASDVLAGSLTAPLGIATDDAAVYWVDLGDGGVTTITGRVVRAEKGGAAVDLVNGLLIPTGVAVDDSAVYYTTSGLSECDGGPGATGTVERIARDGGEHLTLARGQDCPGPIVVHDTRVFWTNQSFGAGTVNVVPKTGGGFKVLAKKQPIPSGLATDGTRVYWINSVVPAGTVLACVIDDCANSFSTLANAELSPISIAIDGTSLFWADLGVPPAQPGSLHRVSLLGVP
jgi:hypothetical protein